MMVNVLKIKQYAVLTESVAHGKSKNIGDMTFEYRQDCNSAKKFLAHLLKTIQKL